MSFKMNIVTDTKPIHGYTVYQFDDQGRYRLVKLSSKDTTIRVLEGIYGEYLDHKRTPIKEDDLIEILTEINNKREASGFKGFFALETRQVKGQDVCFIIEDEPTFK